MTVLIKRILSAKTKEEVIAAEAALVEHEKVFGERPARKRTYKVLVSGKNYQIEIVSAKKYMTAEVRNKHLRLHKINEGVVQ